MAWNLQSDRPIYSQLIERIELKICTGVYEPGSRLPSVRDLAQEASVNPNTMQRALAKLEEDGLLFTNRTSGRFITEDSDMIRSTKNRLAQDQVKEFLKSMKNLGFDGGEILAVISEMLEEMKQ